jgi:hypothetical protein
MDINEQIAKAINAGIVEGIKTQLTRSYQNPLDKLIEQSINERSGELKGLIREAIDSCASNEEFRQQVIQQTHAVLARTLVQRFGGELEKQVNALKSDPATRARITLAIEEIVSKK